MKYTELDRHSPLCSVIKCMQVAIQNLSDNDNIYQDDEDGNHISHEEVSVIINQLSHSDASVIDIADSEALEAYMAMLDEDK